MAEESNLKTNNLCTTEDAFEQFQAVSMYQEPEYITLADIVSPEPEAADLTSDLSEIPYDNEVVLAENIDEQIIEENSQLQTGTVEITYSELQATENFDDTLHTSIEPPPEDATVTSSENLSSRPKRVSNKRIFENSEGSKDKNIGSDKTGRRENRTDITVLSTPTRKRGRKPKNKSTNHDLLIEAGHNVSAGEDSCQVMSNKASVEPTTSTPDISNGHNNGRRGRPKKYVLEETVQNSVDTLLHPEQHKASIEPQNGIGSSKRSRRRKMITNPDSDLNAIERLGKPSDYQTIDLSLIGSENRPKRRGRPKKLKEDTATLDEQNEQVNNESSTEENMSLSTIKKSYRGKRGRPKRVPAEQLVELKNEQEIGNIASIEIDNDGDGIALSKLKETLESNCPNFEPDKLIEDKMETLDPTDDNIDVCSTVINSESQEMADIESNLACIVGEEKKDFVMNEEITDKVNVPDESLLPEDSLLIEDTSKRPKRRKIKQRVQYDEESEEEDPFANIELSDDEPRRKGKKCYSDDEYVPGGKRGKEASSSDASEDSDIDEEVNDLIRQKRKRGFNENSPRKRGRPVKEVVKRDVNVTTITPDADCTQVDDIEICLQSSVIKANEDPSKNKSWGTTHEFENFIATKIHGSDLKIKKVSASQQSQSTPLEIPVLDPEAKKSVETCSQTNIIHTKTIGLQTASQYEVPMKINAPLKPEQSEKACEFLKSIVQTTSELGKLMTQKSEDFITKKINTENVTDTFKMDYCVRKSFLLLKLAKHNLVQMEEDLSKQYEEFLKSNDLQSYREKIKQLVPSKKTADSDSDCEIVESPVQAKKIQKDKPKFNPKTVFLNKELSIKIAKKPAVDPVVKQCKEKLNIKGRHTVWISDSVMVKKIKPTQSFLAQDSRNKKPPDQYITEKMVSDFFKTYYKQQASIICAAFTSKDWLINSRSYVCSYFFVDSDKLSEDGICLDSTEDDAGISDVNETKLINTCNKISSPGTLLSLCMLALQKHSYLLNTDIGKEDCQNSDEITDLKEDQAPETLFRLCINSLTETLNYCPKETCSYNGYMCNENSAPLEVPALTTLCYNTIYNLMKYTPVSREAKTEIIEENPPETVLIDAYDNGNNKNQEYFHKGTKSNHTFKSLLSLCVEIIQRLQEDTDVTFAELNNLDMNISFTPHTLKKIALESVKYFFFKNSAQFNYEDIKVSVVSDKTDVHKVKRLADICFENVSILYCETEGHNNKLTGELTINSVNTLSEEAFHNIEEACLGTQDNGELMEEVNFYNDNEFDDDFNDYEDSNQNEDNGWVSQVQMKEFKSYFSLNTTSNSEKQIEESNPEALLLLRAQVKLEPAEDTTEFVDTSIVKTEPENNNLDGMIMIPENIVTKIEQADYTSNSKDPIDENLSASFDVNTFEAFVKRNKLMHELNQEIGDEIFSQSALRVRRQYEPDSDNEIDEDDSAMGLLVPHTFEPLNIETAKDHLMESSSDDDDPSTKKTTEKKRPDRRNRGRPKKTDIKQITKETPTNKGKPGPQVSNDLAILTRKMRDRIRQEEKKNDLLDSDTETLPMALRKEKDKKEKEILVKALSTKQVDKVDDEIQCSNVDSTEQIETVTELTEPNHKHEDTFPGFSAIDQSAVCSYQKYVKYVYDKILGKVENSVKDKVSAPTLGITPKASEVHDAADSAYDRPNSPLINYDDPVELLECEPTMPIFDNDTDTKQVKKKVNPKIKLKDKLIASDLKKAPEYTDRHGWKCYPIASTETKLYKNTAIRLEKLPMSFVQTYFEYQDIQYKSKEDAEVDRLINLSSLNRLSNVSKEVKVRPKHKGKVRTEGQELEHRVESPTFSDREELTASEDEINVDDEVPPDVPLRPTAENHMAKNLLMNENDSDTDSPLTKIKKENDETACQNVNSTKQKPGTKSKTKVVENPESLMLTADKMMNKELNLLHAPVVLKEEEAGPSKETSIKKRSKRISKTNSMRDRVKAEDDSSSEEEKQWVSTKEKLLKRMGNKSNTSSLDDAKRAKLVSEFIERRGDSESRRGRGPGPGRRGRRSSKKMLEREKQLRVLSNELFSDSTHLGKSNFSQSYFKGRRNIRKVIDKKSLARSTVIANMEEFERKCRLNQRQNRLRELLGCDEGVNVLVINDEVCLEYDFVEQQPAVTVHPFFTKVMKAHQYEGVKFMWDACFETLDTVESGHPGGGCILAHCMGLGKTLQVLALLHTVLTHPRVGMQRVLVCCPLSTVLNWVDEIHKWIGPVTDQIKVFELSKLKKTYERAYQLEDWYNGGGIFIIGYELFRSLTTLDPEFDDIRPTILNKIRTALLDPGPDIIVCDEGHLLKNDCSVLAVAMSRVVTKRRIVLTGTPMQNNLREYYCMVNFIKPNLLGTYSEYSNRFENPIMNGQHRDSQTEDTKLMKQRTHILHKVLEGCLQRQEASVLYPYLPKKHEYTVFISLTKCQWDLYKHYLQHYANKSKQQILKDFHTLQKIWSHPQVLHNFQMRTRDSSGNKIKPEKLEDDLAHEDLAASEDIKPADTEVWWLQYLEGGAMLEALESSNKFLVVFKILDECVALEDKVLIFSTSLITMDSLEYFLKKINKWSLGQEYYRLDGSVPAEVRQKWCREFNAEHNLNTKLFLISTRAGSLGLNLVAANRVIILDTSWNPAHDIQSIFRVYRFGQKKDCYIYRLVAMGTMEQKIYERSVTKQAIACRVVDEQLIDRHYNMAELTELYKYDELGTGVAGGVAVGVTDVALLRVARLPALHAVHEHDSLLRGTSEQGLPEHERAAAWMQFQQEHAHKQMQNQLTSSISLHIPSNQPMHSTDKGAMQPDHHPPVFKTEPQATTQRITTIPKPPKTSEEKSKKLKPKTVTKCSIPAQTANAAALQEAQTMENGMVQKIMDILIQHNFATEGKKKISTLVSNVRKIVAYGQVPEGSFNSELTKSIADVLLGSEPTMPPLTDVLDPKVKRGRPKKRKRGRPKKDSTEVVTDEQQDSVIEIDCEVESLPQPDAVDEILPEAKPTPQIQTTANKEKEIPQIETQRQLNSEIGSIIVSDDDEPVLSNRDTTPTSKEAVTTEEEPIPLHPSLLSNKNFIKIVAHTYLEGNPMMDEDAATLAAQYSTQKALKEVESTGKKIHSGPIYDIAIKVLGIDILKKLHKTNPPHIKKADNPDPPPAAPAVPAAPAAPAVPAAPAPARFKAKGIAELTEKRTVVNVKRADIVRPMAQAAAVVPVGMFKMSMPNEPVIPLEESILPDDDDVIIYDPSPAPVNAPALVPLTSPSPFTALKRRNTKPIVRNTILAKQSTIDLPNTSNARTIQISSGKIMMPQQRAASPPRAAPPRAAPPAAHDDTICLDSDDEESITPNIQPTLTIAKKSTSKPVPVCLTAANPQMNPLPQPASPQLQGVGFHRIQRNQNFVVIPKSDLGKLSQLPKEMVPVGAKVQRITKTEIPPLTSMSQNMNLSNAPPMATKPQGYNSLPQNYNLMSSATQACLPGFTAVTSAPQMAPLPSASQSSNTKAQTVQATKVQSQKPTCKPVEEVKKTVCKRGDILRITKTGQVEIHKRDKDVSIRDEVLTSSSPSIPLPEPSKGRTQTQASAGTSVGRNAMKPSRMEPIRQISSSSSSSSEESRPPSPDDPLAILRDVVHIRAADDYDKKSSHKEHHQTKHKSQPSTSKQTSKTPSTQHGNTSITKAKPTSHSSTSNSNPPKSLNSNISITKGSTTISSLDKLSKDIKKTDNIMKKLNNVYGFEKKSNSTQSGRKSSAVPTRHEPVELIELDSPPRTSNRPLNKPSEKKKEPWSKIVGTSKNIILKGSGKAMGLPITISNSMNRPTATAIEKIAPSSSAYKPWSDGKKRAAVPVETTASKKKKTAPMTLKDFDIDDLDDIIELD